LRGPGHTRLCECLLLLQCADGKERTGAYPSSSFLLTDTRPGDSVSSICSRGRESMNEQEPHTALAGGRASTAARSPEMAAKRSLSPSTSPAAASTGNAESPQVDAGDDPPTATAEPRSRSCNRAGSTCCHGERNRQQRDTRASLPRSHAANQARKVVVVVYCRETTASCCIYL
jgi:hypothetical protein